MREVAAAADSAMGRLFAFDGKNEGSLCAHQQLTLQRVLKAEIASFLRSKMADGVSCPFEVAK